MKGKGLIFTLEARRERLSKAQEIVLKSLPIEYNRLVAIISVALGVREEKAKEYIRIIREVNQLEADKGIIKKMEG